jgi:hypothetical protein
VDCEVGRLRALLSSERETALNSLRESQQHRLALQQQVRGKSCRGSEPGLSST